MTLDDALTLFLNGVEEYQRLVKSGREPFSESESFKFGLENVLSASDREWADKYLSLSNSISSVNWQLKEGYLSPTPLVTET
jgi:hypothetical protein